MFFLRLLSSLEYKRVNNKKRCRKTLFFYSEGKEEAAGRPLLTLFNHFTVSFHIKVAYYQGLRLNEQNQLFVSPITFISYQFGELSFHLRRVFELNVSRKAPHQ
jgi:hypothetical protein